MKKLVVGFMIIAMMGLMAGVAGADTLLYTGVTPGETPTVYITGYGWTGVSSGMYNFTLTGSYAGSYKGFCVDPAGSPGSPGVPNPYDGYSVIAVGNGTIYEAAAYLLGTKYGLTSTDSAWASKVQMAIWELVFDNGNVDLTGGNFRYTGDYASAVRDLANEAKAAAAAGDYTQGFYLAVAPNPEQYYGKAPQDFIFKTPEPGTMILFGLGMIGLAGLRRKK